MKPRTAWIVYSLARLAFFAVPFAALMFIGWPWWLSAIVASLAAVSLSIIFLARQREAASASFYEWRHRDRTEDDIAEDAALDASQDTDEPAPSSTESSTAADEGVSSDR